MDKYIVDTNTWHYRMAVKSSRSLPDNYCAYWRLVVGEVTGMVVSIAMATFLGFAFVGCFFGALSVAITTADVNALAFSVCIVIGYGILAFFVTRACIRHETLQHPVLTYTLFSKASFKRKTPSPLQPGLIMMKLKSIKEGICPLVEYR